MGHPASRPNCPTYRGVPLREVPLTEVQDISLIVEANCLIVPLIEVLFSFISLSVSSNALGTWRHMVSHMEALFCPTVPFLMFFILASHLEVQKCMMGRDSVPLKEGPLIEVPTHTKQGVWPFPVKGTHLSRCPTQRTRTYRGSTVQFSQYPGRSYFGESLAFVRILRTAICIWKGVIWRKEIRTRIWDQKRVIMGKSMVSLILFIGSKASLL